MLKLGKKSLGLPRRAASRKFWGALAHLSESSGEIAQILLPRQHNFVRNPAGFFAHPLGRRTFPALMTLRLEDVIEIERMRIAFRLSFAKTSSAFSFNNLGKPDITC